MIMTETLKNIEQEILTLKGTDQHTLDYLHREYEAMKWMFVTSEKFLSRLKVHWYHLGEFFTEPDKNYNRQWLPEAESILTEWYEEMFRVDPPTIVPGQTGCTVHFYSDRRAGTIMDVEYSKTKKDIIGRPMPSKIHISLNETKCIDYYAGTYEILPELWKEYGVWTLRKNGYWYEEGHPMQRGEVITTIGERNHYIDPSF